MMTNISLYLDRSDFMTNMAVWNSNFMHLAVSLFQSMPFKRNIYECISISYRDITLLLHPHMFNFVLILMRKDSKQQRFTYSCEEWRFHYAQKPLRPLYGVHHYHTQIRTYLDISKQGNGNFSRDFILFR